MYVGTILDHATVPRQNNICTDRGLATETVVIDLLVESTSELYTRNFVSYIVHYY